MSGRMLDRRAWLAAGLVAALLMVAATWVLVISPSRADTQQLHDDTASLQQQNAVLAQRTAALREQATHREEYRTDLEEALLALPAQTRLPELSRQLARQARSHGVSVTSISVGTPAPPASNGTSTTPATVLQIPVTIVSEGPALAQLRFLRDVQRVGPRRALVTDTSISADDTADSVRTASIMTVQLQVFTAVMTAQQRADLAALLSGDGTD